MYTIISKNNSTHKYEFIRDDSAIKWACIYDKIKQLYVHNSVNEYLHIA